MHPGAGAHAHTMNRNDSLSIAADSWYDDCMMNQAAIALSLPMPTRAPIADMLEACRATRAVAIATDSPRDRVLYGNARHALWIAYGIDYASVIGGAR